MTVILSSSVVGVKGWVVHLSMLVTVHQLHILKSNMLVLTGLPVSLLTLKLT